jgi:hypothetical protein
MWVLGSSDPDRGYEKAVGWAEHYVELEAEEGNDTVSGIYGGEKRNVSIAIRRVGDDTAAAFVYVTSSIYRFPRSGRSPTTPTARARSARV